MYVLENRDIDQIRVLSGGYEVHIIAQRTGTREAEENWCRPLGGVCGSYQVAISIPVAFWVSVVWDQMRRTTYTRTRYCRRSCLVGGETSNHFLFQRPPVDTGEFKVRGGIHFALRIPVCIDLTFLYFLC